MNRKRLLCAATAILVALGTLGGCTAHTGARRASGVESPSPYPWDDTRRAMPDGKRAPGGERAYTIMIYMNGSDLESESGAATADLQEILASGVDTEQVNVVIFTGGAIRWHNDAVPADQCALWRVDGGELEELGGVGLLNMGDPDTLAGFLDYAYRCFPAKKYGLILWDHGGGSIAGYGHDELFGNSRLSLSELDNALGRLSPGGCGKTQKLEFIGFDACLMASVEMAAVASRHSEYLIASQDLEPGDGWDYSFLSALNAQPGMDGLTLGKTVTDRYFDFYGADTDEGLTMSVTRLSEAQGVMDALGALTARCGQELRKGGTAFRSLARRRGMTKSFGNGSSRDNDCDMVDAGDMAAQLSDMFPDESGAVSGALERAVAYKRHNSDTALSGLTAYYIYGGGTDNGDSLETYAALNLNDDYTGYLTAFAEMMDGNGRRRSRSVESGTGSAGDLISAHLTVWKRVPNAKGRYYLSGKHDVTSTYNGADAKPDRELRWPAINGVSVCLDKTDSSAAGGEYAVPVRINGKNADIIVLISDKYPDGKIMGSRYEDGYIIQKGLDPVSDGDTVEFYRKTRGFGDKPRDADEWQLGAGITVKDGLTLSWHKQRGDCRYCYLLTGWDRTERYTAPLP